MNKRKVRLFSFFIFMSFLFAFRGWGGGVNVIIYLNLPF
jgi:hypothetical protein